MMWLHTANYTHSSVIRFYAVQNTPGQYFLSAPFGFIIWSNPKFNGFFVKLRRRLCFLFTPKTNYPHFDLACYFQWVDALWAQRVRRVTRKFYMFGLGNRIEGDVTPSAFKLNVGWSREVSILTPHPRILQFEKISWRRSKQAFRLIASHLQTLQQLTFLIRKLNPPDVYQGSGVRFLRETFTFRKRKKWGVF